ncbi:MAG TPA: NAD-dependent epimerase/dehydratase family protein [Thermoanaerobaculia bacterium]|jgi:2'-hydroxyisoflavone reductase|nr:NAD-dependent epimerase/dehydratase family protein [Thermoanaerobaculia bacterium]
MSISRRTFLATSAAGVATITLSRNAQPVQPAAKPLRILILGGTGFIGPNQVRYAVARGHKVTVFNRGKTNPNSVPAGVERLEGDRNGNLESLKGKQWDAVIDNPTTLPRWVRDAAAVLKGNVEHYMFISTISVYKDNSKPNADESGELNTLEDPTVEKVTGETYGGLKALAEAEAQKAFPGRTTIVRPGLIVGPGDNSDRFTYWPVRIDKGGEVLAPGNPTDPVQFIDARDLGEWTIRLLEQKAYGVFNATGPAHPLTMAEMLHGIKAVTTAGAQFTWVPASFLEEQKVGAWMDMPVWIPPSGDMAGFGSRNIQKALNAGLTFRSLADTAAATLEWAETRSAERKAAPRAGLKPEREVEVLKAWHAKQAAPAEKKS